MGINIQLPMYVAIINETKCLILKMLPSMYIRIQRVHIYKVVGNIMLVKHYQQWTTTDKHDKCTTDVIRGR